MGNGKIEEMVPSNVEVVNIHTGPDFSGQRPAQKMFIISSK